jgi:hypothetical protein
MIGSFSTVNRATSKLLMLSIGALVIAFSFVACAQEDSENPAGSIGSNLLPTSTPAVSVVNGITHVVIHLSPTEGEGQTGYATLSSDGSSTSVEISIEPPTIEAQPIHIHAGICTDVGTVIHALQNVVKGNSVTIIDLPLEQILEDGTLINVHASYADASNYTACGHLPEEL